MSALLRRWRRDERGVAAIEAAIVGALLGMSAAMLLSIKYADIMLSDMEDSLRISAQYVLNGGKDMTRAQELFERSYGRSAESFETMMVCACPPSGSIGAEEEEDAPGSADYAGQTQRLALVQNKAGQWPQCSKNCAGEGDVIRFLEFSSSDTAPFTIDGGSRRIDAKLLIRMFEGAL